MSPSPFIPSRPHEAGRRRVAILLTALGLSFASPAAASAWDDGLAAKQAGRYDEAIAAFETHLDQQPADVAALFQLGTVLGWAGRYDEALTVLDRGLALAPDHLDLRMARGRVLAWSGRHQEALAVFRDILAEAPANLEAANMVGRLQLWSRRPEAAEATFRDILAQAPANVDALEGLGDAYRFEERLGEAHEAYVAALAIDPDAQTLRDKAEATRHAGPWRLSVNGNISTFSGDRRDDWIGWDAELRYALNRRTGLALAASWDRRFNLEDVQYQAAVDHRFSDDLSAYARLGLTDDTDFLARNFLAVGGEWRLIDEDNPGSPWVISGDARWSRYRPGRTASYWLGITKWFGSRLGVTVRGLQSRNLNGVWSGGGLVRFEGYRGDSSHWHLTYADTSEPLETTVIDLARDLRTRAVVLGWNETLNLRWTLRLAFAHEWTDGTVPDRNGWYVGLVQRF